MENLRHQINDSGDVSLSLSVLKIHHYLLKQ
jgi:hypothetical protein